jgi:hypothetical protein
MSHYGMTSLDSDNIIDNDRSYWGVKSKFKRLDEWNQRYCTDINHTFTAFVGSGLYSRWESDLYSRRNAAVHAGVSNYTHGEASTAIAVAKECIAMLESRVPGLQNKIQLNTSMTGYRLNAGEVAF